MPKKIDKTESMEEKLEYLGLNLEKIPANIKKFEPLDFRVPKFYDEKQYRQYRYIPIKDIQILLSPTNRLDEIEEKYKKASPLADYLDSKCEMLDKTIADRNKAIEKLQEYKKSLIYEVVTGKKEV